jgi:hypothetical protein
MRCIEVGQLPEKACAMWLANAPKPPRWTDALAAEDVDVATGPPEGELPANIGRAPPEPWPEPDQTERRQSCGGVPGLFCALSWQLRSWLVAK